MAALLGKKIGMTQLFGEDGRVERVTVIEAGPCHVTAIRTDERDGYVAVQLAFGETKEKRLTKPELGHLKKADAPPLRHLAEFRDEAGELKVGDTVKVDSFEKGQTVKVSGTSKGKGFQGTVKRHNFSRGPVTPRLAQRARPGLDRRLGHALARVQGHPRPGPDGQQARDPARPRDRRRDRRQEPAARPRLGARTRAAAPSRSGATCAMAKPTAAVLGQKTGKADLDEAVFGEQFHMALVHETVRAELNARRRGTSSTKTRGEVAMTGAKAFRQKGTGRARAGALSSAAADRRRHRLRPEAARLHREGQSQGAAQGAARRPVAPRGARHARGDRPGGLRRSPRPRRPQRRSTAFGEGASADACSAPRTRRPAPSRSATFAASACCRPTTSAWPT